MARLLGMCLNCQAHDGPTPDPCGRCESCRAIAAGTSPDVIELDAASNRGIDEIRALQENVRLSPMSGRYKVYIIDEAHQMTKDAYNAFLKTLEEPPAHVVFVLATTEPERILPTVRSRCQRFDFRPIPEPDLVERLRTVAAAEGFNVTDELLAHIARKADGSVRDALGLLEQCVAFAGESPTVEDFLTVTGGVDRAALRRLAEAVRERRAAETIALVDEMVRAGRDVGAVCGGLITYLRDLFLAKLHRSAAAGDGPAADPESPNTASAAGRDPDLGLAAKQWSQTELLTLLDTLAKAEAEMKYSPQPRLVLEMTLLALCLQTDRRSTGTPDRPAAAAERGPAAPTPPRGRPAAPGSRDRAAPEAGPAPRPGSEDMPAEAGMAPETQAGSSTGPGTLAWVEANWSRLLQAVKERSVFVRAFLLMAKPAALEDGVLTLDFESRFHKEQLEQTKNKQVLEDTLSELAGAGIKVECRLLEGAMEPRDRSGTEPPPGTDGGARRRGSRPERRRAEGTRPPEPGRREPDAPPGPRRDEGGESTRAGDASPPEPLRSALAIFGGRVVDEAAPGGGDDEAGG
jgi:DNA polymerase-3 subunit gamma/tau